MHGTRQATGAAGTQEDKPFNQGLDQVRQPLTDSAGRRIFADLQSTQDQKGIMMKVRILVTSLFFAAISQANASVSRLNEGVVVQGNLPFSEAVKVDDILYLSGQVGLVPATQKLIAGGITAESRQTMENISQVLTAHGYKLNDVVKCTVFLSKMEDFPSFNNVYKEYFKPEHLPARSTVAVSGLAMNAKVEVECFAAK